MTDETAVYVRVRGETVRVGGRSAVVGRSRECDVRVEGESASRRHCEVTLRDDGAFVRDLGSAHGTWIDGRAARGEARLVAGALVTLGARGPHFEVVAAVVNGRSVLGAAARVAAPASMTVEVVAPAAAQPPTRAGRGFVVGLAWGIVAGVVVGVAVLAMV